MRAERCWNADDDRVALAEPGEVGRGVGALAREGAGDALDTDVAYVRLAAGQFPCLLLIDIEAENVETVLLEEQEKGEADVAVTDDTDSCGMLCNRLEQQPQRFAFHLSRGPHDVAPTW